jgi:hypothetical protein
MLGKQGERPVCLWPAATPRRFAAAAPRRPTLRTDGHTIHEPLCATIDYAKKWSSDSATPEASRAVELVRAELWGALSIHRHEETSMPAFDLPTLFSLPAQDIFAGIIIGLPFGIELPIGS